MIFKCLRSKHTLLVRVRVPTMYVLDQKYENWVYPCKPQFYYIKVGFCGYTFHGHVFLMYVVENVASGHLK